MIKLLPFIYQPFLWLLLLATFRVANALEHLTRQLFQAELNGGLDIMNTEHVTAFFATVIIGTALRKFWGRRCAQLRRLENERIDRNNGQRVNNRALDLRDSVRDENSAVAKLFIHAHLSRNDYEDEDIPAMERGTVVTDEVWNSWTPDQREAWLSNHTSCYCDADDRIIGIDIHLVVFRFYALQDGRRDDPTSYVRPLLAEQKFYAYLTSRAKGFEVSHVRLVDDGTGQQRLVSVGTGGIPWRNPYGTRMLLIDGKFESYESVVAWSPDGVIRHNLKVSLLEKIAEDEEARARAALAEGASSSESDNDSEDDTEPVAPRPKRRRAHRRVYESDDESSSDGENDVTELEETVTRGGRKTGRPKYFY